MGIAVVSYTRYIDSSKHKTYEDAEATMRGAAESFLTYCSTSPFASDLAACKTMPSTNETVEVDLETLTENGFMEKVADQTAGGHCTGNVWVTNKGIHDNYDLEYRVCLSCSDHKSKGCQ